MKKLAMALLLVASAVNAQPPDVPGKTMPPAVPVQATESKPPTASDIALAKATKDRAGLIVYVGLPVQTASGYVSVRDDSYLGGRIGVYVYHSTSKGGEFFTDASDAAAAVRGVSQPATPFRVPGQSSGDARKAAPQTAEDSPWLSREESERIFAVWPVKVPRPATLRFYDLPRRYQSLTTMNNGRTKINTISPLHDHSASLALSGGMEGIHSSQWKSVKGLAIPAGKKIKVWEEDADVRAFALVPRWRWRFPVGTVAFDLLFNAEGKIFEARTQERTETDWMTKVHKDLASAPLGYRGAGAACASCHNQTALIVDVPERIYRHSVWGDDGRFSWRPYDDSAQLDRRWPIEETR